MGVFNYFLVKKQLNSSGHTLKQRKDSRKYGILKTKFENFTKINKQGVWNKNEGVEKINKRGGTFIGQARVATNTKIPVLIFARSFH